jgi:hypothetical protein
MIRVKWFKSIIVNEWGIATFNYQIIENQVKRQPTDNSKNISLLKTSRTSFKNTIA